MLLSFLNDWTLNRLNNCLWKLRGLERSGSSFVGSGSTDAQASQKVLQGMISTGIQLLSTKSLLENTENIDSENI
jgi:hypothetical protein